MTTSPQKGRELLSKFATIYYLKHPFSTATKYYVCKETGVYGKQTTQMAQMLDSADKNYKVPIINVFKELKETVFKEQNEGMITVSHKIEYQLRYRNYKKETNGNAGVRIEKYSE